MTLHLHFNPRFLAAALALAAAAASAQSTVGELLDQGGQKLLKTDYAQMAPFRVKYIWFQGGGEGDILFNADGTLSGSEYHYSSRSETPATGSWTVDETGKWCVKKNLSVWNRNTDVCWYGFRSGDQYYGTLSEDRAARVGKIKSLARNTQ